MQIKTVYSQQHDGGVAQMAEGVEKVGQALARRGQSIKNAKWWSEVQVSGRELSVPKPKQPAPKGSEVIPWRGFG
jgi:hypothetical protein